MFNISRDDPKGPGASPSMSANEIEEEVTIQIYLYISQNIHIQAPVQVPIIDLAQVCLCELCPEIPEKDSKCCHCEDKNKAACEEEGVTCIIRLKKMSKIWDKVSTC